MKFIQTQCGNYVNEEQIVRLRKLYKDKNLWEVKVDCVDGTDTLATFESKAAAQEYLDKLVVDLKTDGRV